LQLWQADLAPDEETEKGLLDNSNVEFPKRLVNRVSLGVPKCQPITAALLANDQELRDFRNSRAATSGFYLIHLACTFHPADDDPFYEAWLTVNLSRTDEGNKERPIAWSMKPKRQGKDVEITKELNLGADLKFMDAGVEVGSKKSTKRANEEVFIQAFGELQSETFWEFRRFEGAEIRGSYRFAMIVEVPKGINALGVVNAQAKIKRKALGITYRTDFENAPQLTVTIA
jgi:hypothetical protein